MDEIEQLKEDIIKRYEMSWVDAHITDDMGLIQACKENFRELIERLIEKKKKKGFNRAAFEIL